MPSARTIFRQINRALRFGLTFFCLPLLFAATPLAAKSAHAEAPSGPTSVSGPVEPLQIQTTTGTHKLMVEVARTPEQRITGLMYRRAMPRDQGMLFTFDTDQVVMMWMKNTYIPLDMIFLDRAGVVTAVVTDAVPFSEAIISSGRISAAVIEVNAGVARELGVTEGAVVRHPAFLRQH
jgi:uncharacterized membrane protein (UPF0127 family)